VRFNQVQNGGDLADERRCEAPNFPSMREAVQTPIRERRLISLLACRSEDVTGSLERRFCALIAPIIKRPPHERAEYTVASKRKRFCVYGRYLVCRHTLDICITSMWVIGSIAADGTSDSSANLDLSAELLCCTGTPRGEWQGSLVWLTELDCLGVAAAPGYGKPWIAFARQKFTWSGFDEHSNHLE
jgi:hypothetical protein